METNLKQSVRVISSPHRRSCLVSRVTVGGGMEDPRPKPSLVLGSPHVFDPVRHLFHR